MSGHAVSENVLVSVEERGGISLIEVRGELDADSLPGIRRLLDILLKERRKRVLIDLSRAGFIACSAISVLFEYADRMRLYGGSLKACGLRGIQREIFGSLDFWDNLAMFEDRAGAILSYPIGVRVAFGVDERRSGKDRRESNAPFRGRDRRVRRRRRTIPFGLDGGFDWRFLPPFEGPL